MPGFDRNLTIRWMADQVGHDGNECIARGHDGNECIARGNAEKILRLK